MWSHSCGDGVERCYRTYAELVSSKWLSMALHCSPKTSGELSPSRLCFVRGKAFLLWKGSFRVRVVRWWRENSLLWSSSARCLAPKLALNDRTPSMPFSPEKRENSHELCLSLALTTSHIVPHFSLQLFILASAHPLSSIIYIWQMLPDPWSDLDRNLDWLSPRRIKVSQPQFRSQSGDLCWSKFFNKRFSLPISEN